MAVVRHAHYGTMIPGRKKKWLTNIVKDDERTVDTTDSVVADSGRHVI